MFTISRLDVMHVSRFSLLEFCFVFLFFVAMPAQVPRMLSHQGYLTNALGQPLDTTVSITFQIYSDSTGDSSLWAQTFTGLHIIHGVFTVTLSPIYLPFDQQYWLEIQVGNDLPISPRTGLTSSAYALRADTANFAKNYLPNQSTGWIDEGTIVKLLNDDDSVAIGVTTATSKFQVAGTIQSTIDGFKFPDGTTQITAASQFGEILDYGSSKSSATQKQAGLLKICYGIGVAVNEDGNKATITGLPFSNSTSYTVIVTRDTGTYASQAMSVNRISGSSFEILDFTYSGTASWIALGY